MDTSITTLPWGTVLTIACGYAGYFIAHIGLRDHHKTVDVTFGTLVFGFFGIFAYQLLLRAGLNIFLASAGAFTTAALLGALWSRWGRRVMHWGLRRSRVSFSTDEPSAWLSVFRDTDHATMQLAVKLKDGTWLKCDDLGRFENLPNGPCTFGATGDILMYVTHEKAREDEGFEEATSVLDEAWGAEVTYIPADQIARVDLRRRP